MRSTPESHGDIHTRTRAGLWWLASYPKSGNTWTRALLANYLYDDRTPLPLDRISLGTIASARDLFDRHAGIESSDLTQEEIERYRPLIYDFVAQQMEVPVYVKVHDAFGRNREGQLIFPPSATAGAVYIIRNPFDVAPSFAHHLTVTIERAVEIMGDENHVLAASENRLKSQFRQRLLNWSGHVRSWTEDATAANIPLHVMRYEDLKADTVGEFARLLDFLRIDVESARVRKAVDFCAFDRLQEEERTQGFREKRAKVDRFFRKGQVGSWREQLTDRLTRRLIEDHGEVMHRFGYLTDDGRPVF